MSKTKKKKSGKKHCNSKREVLLMVYEKKKQEEEGKPKNRLTRQLQTMNSIKPALESARKQMAEKNRRESKNDTD